MKSSQTDAGIQLIATERVRQVTAEGYDAAHDDKHRGGELGLAAACYAAPMQIYLHEADGDEEFRFVNPWPFDPADDLRQQIRRALGKPAASDAIALTPFAWRLRELTQAGALIAAEIDRLLRLQAVVETNS